MANTMYSENRFFPDPYKGCGHGCIYCIPSFQRQAKRQRSRCKVLNEAGTPKCYTFEPHAHLEKLQRKPPVTRDGQFVFFPKGGDLAFASPDEVQAMLKYAVNHPRTTFLFGQTKNPEYLRHYRFPGNVILAITLETDLYNFRPTLSPFENYDAISKAPTPFDRHYRFMKVKHTRKAVIIEPVLKFSSTFALWIRALDPEFVYVGYDTKNCKLPEPKQADVLRLIAELEAAEITVRRKTMRKAWYEP